MRILVCLILLNINFVLGQSLINNPNFNLFWSEEFNNGTNINTRWTIANGFLNNSDDPPNQISINNSSSNVFQSNGTIKLSTTYNSSNHQLNRSSISAEVPVFENGFYESSLRFKNGPQIMATFWIHSGNGKCVASASQDYQEIDFLEFFGDVQKTSGGVHCCVCACPNNNENCIINNCPNVIDIVEHPTFNCRNNCTANQDYTISSPENWHNYSGSWRQQDGIRLYQDWEQKSARPNPTNMQLNTSWTGNKNLVFDTRERCFNHSKCMEDIANYPYIYEIDYARVFTLITNCTEVVTTIPNFNTFVYSLKKSFTLSNTTIPAIITSVNGIQRNIVLYATDYIEIKENVEVLSGSNFELGIVTCQ